MGLTGINIGSAIASSGNVTTQALPINSIFSSVVSAANSAVKNATNNSNGATATKSQATSIFSIPQSITNALVSNGIAKENAYPVPPLPAYPINKTNTGTTLGNVAIAVGAIASGNPLPKNLSQPETSFLNISEAIKDKVLEVSGLIKEVIPVQTSTAVTLVEPTIKKREVFKPDELNISNFSIKNNEFVPTEQNGISKFRPEIISIVDFNPIYINKSNTLNANGKLIDITYQSKLLREESLLNIIKELQSNDVTKDTFNGIINNFKTQLDNTTKTINFYSKVVEQIETVKSGLSIKNIPVQYFDTVKFLTPIDFFNKKMLFPKTAFASFSDTKILYQLIHDLREIIENYSFSLFDITNTGRSNESSPTVINKVYKNVNLYRFDISTIRSFDTNKNATEIKFFTNFINALPSNIDDKIKILITILSKEIRTSKNLAKTDVKKQLFDNFKTNNIGSPYDNILGSVGDTIFIKPVGEDSISSLLLLNVNENSFVLPFESKYIDNNENNKITYIPGTSYFIDSILELVDDKFNTDPMILFINRFTTKLNSAKTVIENLLELKNVNSKLNPNFIFKRFVQSLNESTNGIFSQKTINNDQVLITALFKAAANDKELKLMLFQFLCLSGIYSNSANDTKKIFENLAKELISLSSLSYLQFKDDKEKVLSLSIGKSNLFPFLNQLAKSIEEKVYNLINNISGIFQESTDLQKSKPTSLLNVSTLVSKAVIAGVNQATITQPSKTNGNIYTYKKGAISAALIDAINTTTNSSTNFIKEFVDISNAIDQEAQIQGNDETYTLTDDSGRTRYNFLSPSTILLIIFEILHDFANKYSFIDFIKSNESTELSIQIDNDLESYIHSIFDEILDKKLEVPSGENTQVSKGVVITNDNQSSVPGSTKMGTFVPTNDLSVYNAVAAGVASLKGISLANPTNQKDSSFTAANVLAPASLRNTVAFSSLGQNAFLGTTNTPNPSSLIPKIAKLIPTALGTDVNLIPPIIISMRNSLNGIKTKVEEEDITIANVLHIFDIIGNRMQQMKDKITSFSNTGELGSIISFLRETNKTSTAEEQISTLTDEEQTRTAIYTYNKYLGKLNNNNSSNKDIFIQNYPLSAGIKNSLFSLLSEQDFRENEDLGNKIKLITIGIPTGMTKKITERINTQNINSRSFINNQFDLISIDVYKRSEIDENIIFLPQQFIFDLSIFPKENAYIDVSDLDRFDKIISKVNLIDLQFGNVNEINIDLIKNDEKYTFLSNDNKEKLVKNHLVSELMNLYIMFLSGIKLEEETFTKIDIASRVSVIDEQFKKLISQYLIEVKGINDISFDDLFNAIFPVNDTYRKKLEQTLRENNGITPDLFNLIKLLSFGNLMFQPNLLTHKILTPKIFDRTFTIPFNIENFKVDVQQTISTKSGRLAYQKNSFQQKIISTETDSNGQIISATLKPRTKNDFVFDDYFTTISLIGN